MNRPSPRSSASSSSAAQRPPDPGLRLGDRHGLFLPCFEPAAAPPARATAAAAGGATSARRAVAPARARRGVRPRTRRLLRQRRSVVPAPGRRPAELPVATGERARAAERDAGEPPPAASRRTASSGSRPVTRRAAASFASTTGRLGAASAQAGEVEGDPGRLRARVAPRRLSPPGGAPRRARVRFERGKVLRRVLARSHRGRRGSRRRRRAPSRSARRDRRRSRRARPRGESASSRPAAVVVTDPPRNRGVGSEAGRRARRVQGRPAGAGRDPRLVPPARGDDIDHQVADRDEAGHAARRRAASSCSAFGPPSASARKASSTARGSRLCRFAASVSGS